MSHAAPQRSEDAYDQWLVIRAQTGDQEALRRLVERWSPKLRRHAARLTDSPDGACDVTQEAWLAIVRGLRGLDDPACFRRWAYQIVSRRCADWVRARQRNRGRSDSLSEEPPAQPETDPVGPADRVQSALRALEQADRVLLSMRYTDEIPLAEIADVLGVPVGTVKSRLHHARARLKRVLDSNPN